MFLKQRLLFLIILSGLLVYGCGGGNSVSDAGDGFNHGRAPGTSAEAFLKSGSYNSLLIEVDYAEGYRPTSQAIENLKAFLEARLNKPGGITISIDEEIPLTNDESVSGSEIVSLEEEYRDQFTSGNQLAAYILVLDGRYEEGNVLGLAYLNTSMAVFGDLIQDNTGGLGQPSETTVQSTVMDHEFGHILGLVDNGTPAINDHVDEEHGAHCTNESCLMYYAVQNAGFISNLSGGSIPELDADCLQDLAENGGK